MNPVSQILVLLGAVVALIGSIGVLRLPTTYGRIHAGGKASPISFVLIAIGCGIELGVVGGLQLAIASIAIALTLPAATHLLFRAVHRSSDNSHLVDDALSEAATGEVATAPDDEGSTDDAAEGPDS